MGYLAIWIESLVELEVVHIGLGDLIVMLIIDISDEPMHLAFFKLPLPYLSLLIYESAYTMRDIIVHLAAVGSVVSQPREAIK